MSLLTQHMCEPVVAIVVAAGSGVRLGSSTAGGSGPKALRLLAGEPLVRHCVRRLLAGGVAECIVVIPAGAQAEFRAALAGLECASTLVPGGACRQESVRNGLAEVSASASVVLVHDAARPLVPPAVVARVIAAVRAGAQAVVPVVPVVDSVRRVEPSGSVVVDRSALRAVQTPQGFAADMLREAHAAATSDDFTDDASVCESAGCVVALVAGDRRSLKITEPADFAFAEALLKEES